MRLFLYLFLFSVVHTGFAQKPDSVASLKLLFAGDIMGHRPQISSAEILRDKVFDYDPCFQYIKPIVRQADLAIGNLEVTLPGKPPYQGYPLFRSPDDLALALRTAGFDLMVTANNHSNDSGKNGVIQTIETLQSLGFYQTGTFKNAVERELFYPLIVYKNGFKLAFLNYTYDTNGVKTRPPTLVNEIDETLIQKDMVEAKGLNPDAIIVLMHWGDEYKLQENTKQRKLAQKIISWGADLIIGSHPHVIQPIKAEVFAEGDRKIYVAYSLGNFISNQSQPNTDGGLMLEVELYKSFQDKKTRINQPQYIPVWRYIHRGESGKITFHALPASAFESAGTDLLGMDATSVEAMKHFLQKTRNHLQAYNCSERKIALEELGLYLQAKNE